MKVVSNGTYYDFYIDNVLIAENYQLTALTDGCVGLLSYYSYTTFYSFEYNNFKPTRNPTNIPTSNPSNPHTNHLVNLWLIMRHFHQVQCHP